MCRVVTAGFPARPEVARDARRTVSGALRTWGVDPATGVADTAMLLVSELVTNGVRHAGSPVGLAVALSDRVLEVRVTDQGPALALPRPLGDPAAPGATGGRGLWLVSELAGDWGVDPRTAAGPSGPAGKTVWFRLPVGDWPDRAGCRCVPGPATPGTARPGEADGPGLLRLSDGTLAVDGARP